MTTASQLIAAAARGDVWAVSQMTELLSHQNARVSEAEASRTPAGRLRHHAADPDPRVRAAAAENPRCPSKTLAQLAADSSESVRESVAANVACPGDLLDRLAGDEDRSVREMVAQSATSAETLDRLAGDEDRSVREMVAQSATSAETLDRLAGDDEGWVRVCVACNAKSPADVLAVLESDPYVLVYDALAGNPGVPPGLARRCAASADPAVRYNVAARADATNADLFAVLAADPDAGVRVMVAMNDHCPADLLAVLAADAAADVREGVAWRRCCPIAVRAKLATDPNRDVRSEALPHLAADTLTAVAALIRGALATVGIGRLVGKAAA